MDAGAWQAGARLIGWALLHFVWQGALVGGLYALLRGALPRGNPRYLLGMLALIVLALCPVLTAITLWHGPASVEDVSGATLPDLLVGGGVVGDAGEPWLDTLLPWLALAWSCGVLWLSLRAWRQWRRLQRVLRLAERLPEWERRARDMARQFGLRRPIAVWRSAMVATPALIGWLRPVIVLPAALLGGFPVAQIEWLLAHELAHLRRWDPLCHLLQLVLETLLFYHPAVHWISRDVRNERELCCDALALAVRGGDRRDFARALAGLADLREQHATLLLAANGGLLLERVQRLAVVPARREHEPARPLALAMGLLLTLVAASMVARMPRQWLPRVDAMFDGPRQHLPAPAWSLIDLLPLHAQALTLRPQPEAAPLDAIPAATPAMAMPVPHAVRLQVADLATPTRAARALAGPAAAPAMPTLLHVRQPLYPPEAYEHGIEGRVLLEFGIGSDGRVRDLRVVGAEPAGMFELAALRAMREWQFALSGANASGRYRQAMVFNLHATARADGEAIAARIGCRVVTGTHICRLPEEERAGGDAAAAASLPGAVSNGPRR